MNFGDSSESSFALGESHEALIIKKLKKENKKLSEENVSLLQRLAKTKRQFESAINESSEIEAVKKKNEDLEQEIVKISSEKAELEKRLQIALKTLNETERKLSYTKTTPTKVISKQNGQEKQKETNSQKLFSKISALEEELQRERSRNYSLQAENDQIYDAASRCFSTNATNPQKITEVFFEVKQLRENLSLVQNNYSKLVEKNKKLKERFAEAENSLKEKLKKSQNETKEAKETSANYLTKTNALSETVNELKEKISALKAEKENLLKQNATNKKETEEKSEEERKEKDSEITKLVEEIAKLKEGNASFNQERTEAQFKIEKLENELKNTTQEKETTKNKILKWKKRCHAAENDLKVLQSKPLALENDPRDEEILSLREKCKENISKCKKLEKTVKKLNEKETELIETTENLAKKLKDEQKKLKEVKEKNQIDLNSISRCQIPNRIIGYVNEVSSNMNTPIATKVQNIINAILDYANEEIEKSKDECESLKAEVKQTKEKLSTVTSFIGRLFPDVQVNYESLAEEEKSRECFIRSLDTQKSENEAIKAEIKELQTSIAVHFGILGVESFTDAKTAISKLILSESTARKENKTFKKKLNEASKAIKAISSSLEKEESLNSSLQQELAVTKKENQTLKESITELQNLPPDPKLVSENKKQRKKINELSRITKQINEKLNETENKLSNAKKEMERLCEELENSSKYIRKERKEEERLIGKLKEQKEIIKDLKKQMKKEREECNEQIEKLNKESAKAIAELRNIKEEQEKEIEQITDKNIELTAALHSAETKFAAMIDEKEREKKQLESQLNAKLLSLSSNLRSQIEEANLNNDMEVKQLIQALIQTFPFIYDGATEINKSLYEKYLADLRNKFDDLSQKEYSIRALLGITGKQSIEQAIKELRNAAEQTEI